jgi:RHS repeat-associated protein
VEEGGHATRFLYTNQVRSTRAWTEFTYPGVTTQETCVDLSFGDDVTCNVYAVDNDYWAGQRQSFDPSEGFWARHYDTIYGRFMQPDPARAGSNLYVYANNNPVNSTDPLGLEDEGDGDDDGGGFYGGSSPGFINASNPTSFQLWSNLPTVGGRYGSNGAASEAAYASWVNAQWQAGGSSITWRNGVTDFLNWTISGGVYGVNGANGEIIDAADAIGEAIGAGIGPVASPPLFRGPAVPTQIVSPQQSNHAKGRSASKYGAFLGCMYNSVVETVTDLEDGRAVTAYGFINTGAIWAIQTWQANVIGLTFVATAGAMDVGAMAKANNECTKQIYP